MSNIPKCKSCPYYVHGIRGTTIKIKHWCCRSLGFAVKLVELFHKDIQTSPKDCPLRNNRKFYQ